MPRTQQDLSSLSNNSHSIGPGDQQQRDRAKFLAKKAAVESTLRMKAAVPNNQKKKRLRNTAVVVVVVRRWIQCSSSTAWHWAAICN